MSTLLVRAGAILCLAIAASAAQQAGDPAALFAQANVQYQRGDYAGSERVYRRILEAGYRSGSLYYNLGNSAFKQRKLGEAIYYWEKARALQPHDADISENLEFAGLLVVDRVEVPADPLPVRALQRVLHALTMRQETFVLLALFFAANVFFSAFLFVRNPSAARASLAVSLACLALCVFSAASLGWKVYESKYRREAVVVQPKVHVRSSPGRDGIVVFTVHEGIKVRVRGSAAGWYQVGLPNGWSGWLDSESVWVL